MSTFSRFHQCVIATALALPITTILTGQPAAAEDIYFDLENQTSSTITHVFIVPSNNAEGVTDWGENLLDGDSLPVGDIDEIGVEDDLDTCYYDIRIKFAAGDEIKERSVDLCELDDTTYTLTN